MQPHGMLSFLPKSELLRIGKYRGSSSYMYATFILIVIVLRSVHNHDAGGASVVNIPNTEESIFSIVKSC